MRPTRTLPLPLLAAGAVVALLVGCQPDEGAEMVVEEPPEVEDPGMRGEPDTADLVEGDLPTALRLDTLASGEEYITDAYGRALYLFTADSAGTSACHDDCAEAWPPFTAPEGDVTADSPELDPALLGTMERQDGTTQVTYGGHPLYYYAEDVPGGKATGQDVSGFGGEWYLVTPSGEMLEAHGVEG